MGLQDVPFTALISQIQAWNKQIVVDKVFGSIPVVSDILYGIVNVLSTLMGLFITLLTGLFELGFAALWLAIDKLLLLPLSVDLRQGLRQMAVGGYLDDKSLSIITNILAGFGDYQNLATIFVSIKALMSYVGMLTDMAMVKSQQDLLSKILPSLIAPEVAVRNMYLTPNDKNALYEILHKQGYDDQQIYYLFKSGETIHEVETLKTLFLRKYVGSDYVKDEMSKAGYSVQRIDEIMKTWDLIPGVQDILWMVAKEAFEPDQVNRYSLDDEFPNDQVEWLQKSGLNIDWIKKYWIAHWQYPAPGQVLEMLHRGLISEEDVYQYYRVIEMPPYWRNMLMKISYKPLTRVDVRRMHAMQVIDDAGLIEAYMHNGYSKENAALMSKFTINYNQKGDKELSKTEVENLYLKGIITYDECDTMLRDVGYSPATVSIMMRALEVKLQTAYIDEAIEAIQQNYQNNNYSYNDAEQRMGSIGIPTIKITALLAKWDLKRLKDDKKPTKEDLKAMLLEGVITVEDYEKTMYLQGYSMKYIRWYLKLIQARLKKTVYESEELE
jgi:hypothetical protein